MNQINYTENYDKKSFADFVQSFGAWKTSSEIVLTKEIGKGSIKVLNVEQGLQLRIWDCTFEKQVTIFREPVDDEAVRTFTLAYYLSPESFVLHDHLHPAVTINQLWNTVLMSSDAYISIDLIPGKPMRCVSLNFTSEWVEKNVLCDLTLQHHILKRFAMSAEPFAIYESQSYLENHLTDSLFGKEHEALFSKFFFRSKALNLLTEFFSKIVTRLSEHHGADLYHEEQMAAVEKELVKNICNGLPELKLLAKKVGVSETTLKRYFRRIYGKNIYAYYLSKRMAFAKRLLKEKKKTVSETASIMGYESVSHFSQMFKKIYGLLPGKVAKHDLQA